jgi:signal transduction histidine kinase
MDEFPGQSATIYKLEKELAAKNRAIEVEAALEHVRARTMTMLHSDELMEAANLLFQQVHALGIPVWTCGFNIWAPEEKICTGWMSTNGAIQPPFRIPLTESPLSLHMYESRIRGEDYYIEEMGGEALSEWYRFMLSLPDFKAIANEQLKDGFSLPTSQVNHVFNFKQGNLIFIAASPLPENLEIFKRFAKVFEQTYTRFLDLQKAEGQAREAQIEVALEKIRSRSLGMHSSVEIKFVVAILFEKLKELNLEFDGGAAIHLFTEGTRDAVIWVVSPDLSEPSCIHLPFDENLFADNPIITDIWKAKETGDHIYNKYYSFDEKNTYFNYVFKHNDFKTIPETSRAFIAQADSYTASFIAEKNSLMGANSWSRQQFSEDDFEVLKRIARVFEQAYVRFLDLQKAEAQAREAQVEIAMERVRSRSMAMHTSEELREVAIVLYNELKKLGFQNGSGAIVIMDPASGDLDSWVEGSADGYQFLESYHVPFFNHETHLAQLEHWKKGTTYIALTVSGEAKKRLDKYYFSETDFIRVPEATKNIMMGQPTVTFSMAFMRYGAVSWQPSPISEEQTKILQRFSQVFEQSYTRFLDLQKSEAQTREAQIELALERVRARTMAMQKSEDLREVVMVLYAQLANLGFQWGAASITIMDSATGDMDWWLEGFGDGYDFPESYHVPFFNHIGHQQQLENWKNGSIYSVVEISGIEKKSYDNYYFNHTDFSKVPENTKQLMKQQEAVLFSMAYMKYGALSWSPTLLSEVQSKILQRFAKVFEQTYTRFLDLQKAEAQAKEAQIQLALERLRARTMAMHQSSELAGTASVMFEQLSNLGASLWICGFNICKKDSEIVEVWVSPPDGKIMEPMYTPYTIDHFSTAAYEIWKNQEGIYTDIVEGLELQQSHEELLRQPVMEKARNYLIENKIAMPTWVQRFAIPYTFGYLNIVTIKRFAETDIFIRFAKVFDQTYTRFLDLQKAEAQAREAKIEAALERVRAKTMAMQKSEELREVVAIIYQQLQQLGFTYGACSIVIMDELSGDMIWWISGFGKPYPESYRIPFFDHPFYLAQLSYWKEGRKYAVMEVSGKEKKSYDEIIFSKTEFVRIPDETRKVMMAFEKIIFSNAYMKHGALSWSVDLLSDEHAKILQRFAVVFEQTYTRFLDLQKAETQALEAIKRASVDRVRAEIASMRSTNDLQRITPLIWNELTILGIPFIRCGVFIMDEERQEVQTMLSTPEGNAIATLHVPYSFDLSITTNGVQYWRKKEIYKEHWDSTTFRQTWGKLSLLRDSSADAPQMDHPPENLYLHLLPFLQGMLYVGSIAPLNDDELQLGQNLADAFSTAYARYEDFNKLELAKKQVDSTLNELQVTQKQLIQSEKMASLGELTAGIAHEIQNPLNFVNNFSEVNRELLEELNEEIEKGNYDEVKVIAADIAGNEEKISHHGKRADAIVKGMLQHSRATSTSTEPTDINVLADEYLRLAYHGLRAKDKSFNANLQTTFDTGIGKINIIPQDIGRVLLNVMNNAFYAVSEKKKLLGDQYEPTVSVTTKKNGDIVEIIVADNGNGIPQKVVDKIFQPFFTTKPTGQGTGLGLSLAYDIITKGHGGELKVNSVPGEGTALIITLPLTK